MNNVTMARRLSCTVLSIVFSLSSVGCAGRTYLVTQKRMSKIEPQKTTKDEVIKVFGQPDGVEARLPEGQTLVYVQRKRRFMEGGLIGAVGMGLYWGLAGLAFAGGPAGLVVVPPAMLLGGALGAAGGSILVKDISALRVNINNQNVVDNYQVVPK